jgi:hypothetical protein
MIGDGIAEQKFIIPTIGGLPKMDYPGGLFTG